MTNKSCQKSPGGKWWTPGNRLARWRNILLENSPVLSLSSSKTSYHLYWKYFYQNIKNSSEKEEMWSFYWYFTCNIRCIAEQNQDINGTSLLYLYFISHHFCFCSPRVGIIYSSSKNLAYINFEKVNNYKKAATFFAPQVIYQIPHMCPYSKAVK